MGKYEEGTEISDAIEAIKKIQEKYEKRLHPTHKHSLTVALMDLEYMYSKGLR